MNRRVRVRNNRDREKFSGNVNNPGLHKKNDFFGLHRIMHCSGMDTGLHCNQGKQESGFLHQPFPDHGGDIAALHITEAE